MSSNYDLVIEEFNKRFPIYQQAVYKFKFLLEELLKNNNIEYHIVEGRAKELKSFKEKIKRKSYTNPFDEMTDFVGIRIILYYINDLNKVAEILKKEFVLDQDNSVSKKDLLKPNEFGYTSDHYILSLDYERKKLLEWKLFRKIKFEVQVRTVLQHAWASISHMIDYKNESQDNPEFTRRLYRLAGLFELADEEFLKLKSNKLVREITSNLKSDESLNHFNLHRYLTFSNKTKALTEIQKISEELNLLEQTFKTTDYEAEVFSHCKAINIKSITELDLYLENKLVSIREILSEVLIGKDKIWTGPLPFIINILLISGYYPQLDPCDLEDIGWDYQLANKLLNTLDAYSKRSSSFA